MKFTPKWERQHYSAPGIHKLYEFPNGYGASVVRFAMPSGFAGLATMIGRPTIKSPWKYGSYTNNENEWEVAVVRMREDPDVPGSSFELAYDTPITDHVLGYIAEGDELEQILDSIARLPNWRQNLTERTKCGSQSG